VIAKETYRKAGGTLFAGALAYAAFIGTRALGLSAEVAIIPLLILVAFALYALGQEPNDVESDEQLTEWEDDQ